MTIALGKYTDVVAFLNTFYWILGRDRGSYGRNSNLTLGLSNVTPVR